MTSIIAAACLLWGVKLARDMRRADMDHAQRLAQFEKELGL